MTLIKLDQHKRLFRDEASYNQFIQLFRDAFTEGQTPMVIDDENVLFAAISNQAATEMLAERILDRLGENPSLMDDLTNRLENDPIVD
jgi:hypothetical protein